MRKLAMMTIMVFAFVGTATAASPAAGLSGLGSLNSLTGTAVGTTAGLLGGLDNLLGANVRNPTLASSVSGLVDATSLPGSRPIGKITGLLESMLTNPQKLSDPGTLLDLLIDSTSLPGISSLPGLNALPVVNTVLAGGLPGL